jgi:phage/plasmid-like protein (TIGR03299 family)
MRINERNVALQDINEHSAIAVEGVHQISKKSDLYNKAGLDFEVESVNLGKATGNENYDRFYGLRNSKTGHVYTVTGRKYTPIQNHELIDAFDEVRKMYGAEYKNAGVMRGGSRVWVQAQLPKAYTFEIPNRKGDQINSMLTMLIGHDGIISNCIFPTSMRGACNNQFVAMTRESTRDYRIQHYSNYSDRLDLVKSVFAKNINSLKNMYTDFAKLDSKAISKTELYNFLGDLYPMKDDEDERTLNRHNDIAALFSRGAGNLGKSRWDAFNAVTEYVDHHQHATRMANAIENKNHEYIQNRIGSLSTPGGQMDRFKRRALNLLTTTDRFPKPVVKQAELTITA